MSFVERDALWSPEQKEAAARVLRLVEEQGLEVVRVAFPDQHGPRAARRWWLARRRGAAHRRQHNELAVRQG